MERANEMANTVARSRSSSEVRKIKERYEEKKMKDNEIQEANSWHSDSGIFTYLLRFKNQSSLINKTS